MFSVFGDKSRIGLARLNPDGTIDNAFKPFIEGTVYAVLVQPDGKILICGRFFAVNGIPQRAVARLNPDGSLDTSFVPPFIFIDTSSSFALALALQSDGKVLLGGSFINGAGNRSGVIRLNADGSLDNSFNSGSGLGGNFFDIAIRAIAVAPDGKIYVGGKFTTYDGINRGSFVRLNSDGTVDNTFTMQAAATSLVLDIQVQPDGKVLAAGSVLQAGSNFTGQITRFNPNNTVDATFNYGSTTGNLIRAFALQRNGKIVVAEFGRVLRVNENGSLDNTFTPATAGSSVLDVVVQQNGKIVISGDFSSINNIARRGLARLNQDGSVDPNFTPTTGTSGTAGAMALQPDGKILFSGNITAANSMRHVGLGRLFGDAVIPARTQFDFDGDGRADLTVFRPSNGTWYRINSSNNSFSPNQFGIAEDKPVAADYDGDGKTDLAVYRPSVGDWYIINSGNSSFTGIHFGISEDKPAPADFDGDGKADLGVFRPSIGTWYLLRTTAGFTGVQFGVNGDIPMPNAFTR